MKNRINKLIMLCIITFNTGCASTISGAEQNTLDTARENAKKTMATHPGWIPKGAYIAKEEVFYDMHGSPQIYEFILMRGAEDVGSIIGYANTGKVSGGAMKKSITYQLDKYFNEFPGSALPGLGLEIVEKRKIYSGQYGASWALRFKQLPPPTDQYQYVFACSTSKQGDWFEFRQGGGAPECELILNSGAEPLPH